MGSKQFKALEAKWYRKLEKSGFEDIEKKYISEDPHLMEFDSIYFHTKYTAKRFREKKAYFEKAQDLLSRDIFIDGIERRIWALHSAGLPIRRIVLVLASEGAEKNKNEVNQVINELQRMILK